MEWSLATGGELMMVARLMAFVCEPVKGKGFIGCHGGHYMCLLGWRAVQLCSLVSVSVCTAVVCWSQPNSISIVTHWRERLKLKENTFIHDRIDKQRSMHAGVILRYLSHYSVVSMVKKYKHTRLCPDAVTVFVSR